MPQVTAGHGPFVAVFVLSQRFATLSELHSAVSISQTVTPLRVEEPPNSANLKGKRKHLCCICGSLRLRGGYAIGAALHDSTLLDGGSAAAAGQVWPPKAVAQACMDVWPFKLACCGWRTR